MLTNRFWRRRVAVICAMVFMLSLFALNLNALIAGKVEVNQSEAWKLWIFGFRHVCGENPDGSVKCCGNGITCITVGI
jgi:hypothetical protein